MDSPKISDAEFEVMKVVWSRSPLSSQEIIDALKGNRSWTPATIKTLINRLLKKGAVAFEKDGKSYLYRPALSKEDCVKSESSSFLNRVFDGALGPLLLHFAKRDDLSKKDMKELRRILGDGR